MHLKSLHIVNFKNYEEAELILSPDINCFIGKNGSGKTNLLDAVHYLSMCKSYMNPVDRQNIRFEEPFFMIQGNWQKAESEVQIQCSVKQGQKKIFRRNKKEYEKLAEHIGQFPAVMISPYDTDLISEGSEHRRRWMDGIIAQFDKKYLELIQRNAKVLAQRNALLKNMAEHRLFDQESIDVWDKLLADTGTMIYAIRRKFVEEFIPVFQRHYDQISGSSERVGFTYKSQLNNAGLLELIEIYRHKDVQTRFTNAGIHRDDLVFEINGHPIRKFGSQGQQKSFLIALKLAQYEWLTEHLNVKPVLLLDDIFDKLDQERVAKLIRLVSDHFFGQVIITDTDYERIERIMVDNSLNAKLFQVNQGKVSESMANTVV